MIGICEYLLYYLFIFCISAVMNSSFVLLFSFLFLYISSQFCCGIFELKTLEIGKQKCIERKRIQSHPNDHKCSILHFRLLMNMQLTKINPNQIHRMFRIVFAPKLDNVFDSCYTCRKKSESEKDFLDLVNKAVKGI